MPAEPVEPVETRAILFSMLRSFATVDGSLCRALVSVLVLEVMLRSISRRPPPMVVVVGAGLISSSTRRMGWDDDDKGGMSLYMIGLLGDGGTEDEDEDGRESLARIRSWGSVRGRVVGKVY